MSTKIYNGFQFTNKDLNVILKRVYAFRRELEPLMMHDPRN
jgi:uncharacterized protein (DUF2461 family)